MIKKRKCESNFTAIAVNKRVYHEYFIEEEFEAGLVLQGWEVKALRASKVNIRCSYVILKGYEAFLFGANFTPLTMNLAHCVCDPMRTRKLLLNHRELNSLYNCINSNGYTVIVLSIYWKSSWCKVKIGIARGKKQHDKRSNLKEREWQRNKARIMKNKCR